MENNARIIQDFYTAFSSHDPEAMARCYHDEITFNDPVFGTLQGKEVAAMWKMLIEKSKGNLKITFSDVNTHEASGWAKWTAIYQFSKTNRKVVNNVHAEFHFKDGLIHRHSDYFNFWNWARQALGSKGLLLGWTTSMQRKVAEQAKESLRKYLKD